MLVYCPSINQVFSCAAKQCQAQQTTDLTWVRMENLHFWKKFGIVSYFLRLRLSILCLASCSRWLFTSNASFCKMFFFLNIGIIRLCKLLGASAEHMHFCILHLFEWVLQKPRLTFSEIHLPVCFSQMYSFEVPSFSFKHILHLLGRKNLIFVGCSLLGQKTNSSCKQRALFAGAAFFWTCLAW